MTSGEPLIDAENAGSTKMSIELGRLETKGSAMLSSLTEMLFAEKLVVEFQACRR